MASGQLKKTWTNIQYNPYISCQSFRPIEAQTEWYPVLKGSPAERLELTLPSTPPDQSFSLILGIGICFGAMQDTAVAEQVKHAGAAKVLALA